MEFMGFIIALTKIIFKVNGLFFIVIICVHLPITLFITFYTIYCVLLIRPLLINMSMTRSSECINE